MATGVVIAALAMTSIIAGTFRLADAYDPPVPDFRERSALVDPRLWKLPDLDDERFHPLHTLVLLVGRVVSAKVRASHFQYRAWAAFVDRDEPARMQHRDRARDELETLRRLARATTDAADESNELWGALVREFQTPPALESLRETTRRFADELGLTDKERRLIDGRLEPVDEHELQRAFDHTGANALRSVSELVRTTCETVAADFAASDYLQ